MARVWLTKKTRAHLGETVVYPSEQHSTNILSAATPAHLGETVVYLVRATFNNFSAAKKHGHCLKVPPAKHLVLLNWDGATRCYLLGTGSQCDTS